MQTLTPGSFLNLENAETIEALKFTARQLAEHTTNAVKENLDAQKLENLALQLWQKADYVARETERRRLQQIFVENFSERFRELKPEISVSPIGNADLLNQFFASKQPADDETATEKPVLSTEQAPEITEKTDEFLGIVKSDESFIDAPEREADEAETCETKETIQSEREKVPDAVTTQTTETSVAANEQSEEKPNGEQKNAEAVKPQSTNAVKNNSPATSQTNKSATTDAKEPFEFGKCTVSLNLTLLAGSGAGASRKAIISTASHNLPPEIEFLEIADGEDLERIAGLVKDKLARFRGSLPVKYIEQLRTAKSKTAKKSEPTKTPATVAPTPTEKKQPEVTQEKVQTAVNPAPPPVNQPSAANEIQGSLF